MPSAAEFIPVLHRIALAAFVGVTSISMLVGVIRRIRLCRPLVVWQRSGPFGRLPLGPLLFLLLVAVGIGHAWLTGRSVPLSVIVGYPAGGVFWFVATWMMRTVVVTEYGIVHDLGQGPHAVVWSQIVDYFTTTRDGQPHFVFIYRGRNGEPSRLDLSVPEHRAATVRDVVVRKLKTRFSMSDEGIVDEEDLRRLDDRIDLS